MNTDKISKKVSDKKEKQVLKDLTRIVNRGSKYVIMAIDIEKAEAYFGVSKDISRQAGEDIMKMTVDRKFRALAKANSAAKVSPSVSYIG